MSYACRAEWARCVCPDAVWHSDLTEAFPLTMTCRSCSPCDGNYQYMQTMQLCFRHCWLMHLSSLWLCRFFTDSKYFWLGCTQLPCDFEVSQGIRLLYCLEMGFYAAVSALSANNNWFQGPHGFLLTACSTSQGHCPSVTPSASLVGHGCAKEHAAHMHRTFSVRPEPHYPCWGACLFQNLIAAMGSSFDQATPNQDRVLAALRSCLGLPMPDAVSWNELAISRCCSHRP